jgi:hypothetical protein
LASLTWAALLVAAALACAAAPGRAQDAAAESALPAALTDSLLAAADDFDALRPHLLNLTTARVAAAAWELVPRLVTLGRPDLLVGFLEFWEDRCGSSEPVVRTRLLGAIWDGAFDEGLYDDGIVDDLDAWLQRSPRFLSEGRLAFDRFTIAFADQLLPHQPAGSLPEYFCLIYSDRFDEAADLLRGDELADTWLRWYVDHPDGADGGEIVPGQEETEDDDAPGPSSLLLTAGIWRPRGDVALAGDHILVGGVLEQDLGSWFVRVPLEVRLGRTDRPYLVDQDGVRAYSDRFDAVYLGLEGGRPLWRGRRLRLDAFAGLGYDGLRPFLKRDLMLATVNLSLGMGLRWQPLAAPWLLGLDARREWLGTRNEGPDSLGGGADSLRLGAGLRFGARASR